MHEPFNYDFTRELGAAVEGSIGRAKHRAHDAMSATNVALRGRPLTVGETRMIQTMFGTTAGLARARIYPHNFWWPYPNRRAMTPQGNIFFAEEDYRNDFSSPVVPLLLRALFMHEATHLYQWYVLGQWVFLRGPFDRKYDYVLEPSKALKDYGLEQMGQIVQDFYIIRQGGTVPGKGISVIDYRDALPVRRK